MNRKLLMSDLLMTCCLVFGIFRVDPTRGIMGYYWLFLGIYFLVKQVYSHFEFYKESGKIY